MLQSIYSSSLTSIRLDLNDYGSYMSIQEYVDCSLWNELDTILAGLAQRSTGKLGLQLKSSRLKTVDFQNPLPRFKECGILERVHWTIGFDCHPLFPHFDGPEPFRGCYVAENTYWETVDRVHRRIEADTAIRKLEGSRNRTGDTSSLAEKIRRRNVKKRRATVRPV